MNNTNEMSQKELIAFYCKAVKSLAAIMFEPRLRMDGRERLPEQGQLEAYFDGADDMAAAFVRLCMQMVVTDTSDDWRNTLEARRMWSAFLHPRGIASYDEDFNEADFKDAMIESAYLREGVPLLARCVVGFLSGDASSIDAMEAGLLKAELRDEEVDYFVDLMRCMEEELVMC